MHQSAYAALRGQDRLEERVREARLRLANGGACGLGQNLVGVEPRQRSEPGDEGVREVDASLAHAYVGKDLGRDIQNEDRTAVMDVRAS
jgi:hypothetical protein